MHDAKGIHKHHLALPHPQHLSPVPSGPLSSVFTVQAAASSTSHRTMFHLTPPLRRCSRRHFSFSWLQFNSSMSAAAEPEWKRALSLLKSEKNPDRILSICTSFFSTKTTPFSHLDRSILSAAITSLSSTNSSSSIRSLLTSPSLPLPSHLPILLFGQANMLDDAISTFRANKSNTTQSLNALLFACILSDNHGLVPDLFRDLPARYRITPNLITYNTLLKSLCQNGSSSSAFSVFDEMSRKGVKPNLTSFTIALAGLYRDQRLDLVDRLLNLMKKHNCHPRLSVYNVRVQELCKLGRVGEAEELLKEMKPNWETYHHLILGFCGVNDLDEAKRVYGEMRRRGLVPESGCYFTLIHYLCKGGDFEFALGVCKESMGRNWVPRFSTMRRLVDGLVSISMADEAREIVAKVKEKFPSSAHLWKETE